MRKYNISEGYDVYISGCCWKVFGTKEKALAHERMCYHNIENRACPTCNHFYRKVYFFTYLETKSKGIVKHEGSVCGMCHVGNLENHLYYEDGHYRNQYRKNCPAWSYNCRNHIPTYYTDPTNNDRSMIEIRMGGTPIGEKE